MQNLSISGLSGQLGPAFFGEDHCRQWVLEQIHVDGPACPHCAKKLTGDTAIRFYADQRICCDNCGRWYTARTGTVLEDRVVGYRDLVLIMVLTYYGHTAVDIAARLNCDRRTVRRWQKDFTA